MAWTEEQQRAIDLEGTNILVSAGAGSGKTAVLTERVKRKVSSGISVSSLLILTFTNAAAAEMKERIRKALQETPGLREEALKVDSSYITTFDSYSLSVVKKYHTRLNLSSHISITDETIFVIAREKLLEEVLDRHYQKPSPSFLQLMDHFCLKDDKDLKKYLLKAYQKLELIYDKSDYLKNYFSNFDKSRQQEFLDEYLAFLKEKRENVLLLMEELPNYFDEEFVLQMNENFAPFFEAESYSQFLSSMNYSSLRVPRGSSEEGKNLKKSIYDYMDDFKKTYCVYQSSDEILEELESTHSDVSVLVDLLMDFDQNFQNYKRENCLYNFNDIARLAIQLVEDFPDIREEIKNSFQEIMVDEYQDTSDLQEKFISLISRDIVYMVGDIKQSIYRFRHANPDIFREKYNLYRDTSKGEKIDLLKNFRSREEVLDDINLLFDPIMDEKIGGAQYRESHRMAFGNSLYTKEKDPNQDYHMSILTYPKEELGRIRSEEEEAFLIAQDIQEKMNKHIMIFDKEKKGLREVQYRDFVILLDRSTRFDTYKKVFEYFHIPLKVLRDESFLAADDSAIFKNLLKFILCVYENRMDQEFVYTFVSLSRSYLYRIDDSKIYEYCIHKNFQDSILYQDALQLAKVLDTMNLSRFIRTLFSSISYDEKILSTHSISTRRVREEYFYRLALQCEKLGYTIYQFVRYLEDLFEGDCDLKFSVQDKGENSCQIMSIHKSKGLEFPICYFAQYSANFNMMELKDRILFDSHYGFILPKVDGYYKDTILKILLKERVKQEEISEKIRLFYVATTRAKEKMIFVLPSFQEDREVRSMVPRSIRGKYHSFYDIMNSISSLLGPYLSKRDIIASKEYLTVVKKDALEVLPEEDFEVEELSFEPKEITARHFSKEEIHLVTKEQKQAMAFGTKVHEILEELDFSNPVLLDTIPDSKITSKIRAFLDSDFMKKLKSYPMYKEYEFYYYDQQELQHGIIDLLIDLGEEAIIVDYKLKNIFDENYTKQLNGYRTYIEEKTGKKVRCYLYSILDEKVSEVLRDNL